MIWFQPRMNEFGNPNSPPKLGGVAARINVSQNCARRRGGSKGREATLWISAKRTDFHKERACGAVPGYHPPRLVPRLGSLLQKGGELKRISVIWTAVVYDRRF